MIYSCTIALEWDDDSGDGMRHSTGLGLGLSILLLGTLRAHVLASDTAGSQLGALPAQEPAGSPLAGAVATLAPDLALAEVYQDGVAIDGYLVSEKLDGVRGYWDGRRLITRGGLILRAPGWFVADFPALPLDGELWMGRGTFARLSGTIRRFEPDEAAWREIRFMLFDLPDHPGDFATRLAVMRGLVAASPSPFIGLVEQTPVTDRASLMARLEQVVAAGGEGLMLHRRDAEYRAGRSSDRLKLKPYHEGEARVIAHLPGRGRHAGRLGALLVEEPDGTRFRLGTGFTDLERESPPALGSRVSFKHHGRTVHGRPRFASFLRLAETL